MRKGGKYGHFMAVLLSAFAAELSEPAREDRVGIGFDVQKFKAHADSGFDDTDHGEGFDGFVLAL
jgi:hypothetical protein